MPGILPMKVIKVGASAQSRIAQACDRCRSKKIRCDGVRPCCSQCASVGFECKTSDKLSRRAFPRGYTESLEERVRGLEVEVRDLKDLLDEKDEKIDMLSRIHSQSSQPFQRPLPRRPSTTPVDSPAAHKARSLYKDEVFEVQQPPYLLSIEGSDSYFSGTSSTRTFVEAFKNTVRESGRSTTDISTELLLGNNGLPKAADSPLAVGEPVFWRAPPRLVSDQLINIFFQEWAPLFPVLHRPTFVTLYERYVADVDAVTDKAEIALLNLVFGIASLSSGSRSAPDLDSFERQWKAAIDTVLTESTMVTLQVLLLAQIFCVQQGDSTRLLAYKGLATMLSARLGLHQSQKRFVLGTLTCETRKKVFWTLYTIDSFTAVILGLPRHLKDNDVQCEYPVDADDENVSERGFQPSLPGESTKLSSALALFRAARILSKVLEEVFPAKASYDLSFKTLSDLGDELDDWSSSLAPHLRLQFAQDKPSTGTISSRSPLLSLTYHYIKALIHRPAVCASIGNRASSSLIALASSAKHMVQIVQLLEERGMCFAFCVNKDELLVLSGFSLMFQGLGLDSASKMLKDNQKMIRTIVKILHKSYTPCASEFDSVAAAFLPSRDAVELPPQPAPKSKIPLSRHNSDPVTPTQSLPSLPTSTRKQLKAIASRFTANASSKTPRFDASDGRRTTLHNINPHPNGAPIQSQLSLQPSNLHCPASISRSEPARSPDTLYNHPSLTPTRPSAPPISQAKSTASPTPEQQTGSTINLDFMSFGGETEVRGQQGPPPRQQQHSPTRITRPIKTKSQDTDWEKLLGSLDNGQTNIYDACYGGQPVEALLDVPSLTHQQPHNRASSTTTTGSDNTAWSNADPWALYQTDANTTVDSALTTHSSTGHAGSIHSPSSSIDELGVGGVRTSDEYTQADWLSVVAEGTKAATSRGIVMPVSGDERRRRSLDVQVFM